MKITRLHFLAALLAAPASLFASGENDPIKVADYAPPIRVSCVGDSITHGVGANTGWAWPDQLDRMLGAQWDVRNFGHSGATVGRDDKHSIWSQKEYKEALLFHPDVVIILLGTNDTKPENWAKKDAFPKLYKELVVSFQQLSSNPRVWCGTPPYVAKKGAFGINEGGVLEQIPLIQKVAKEHGAGLADVHAAMEGRNELFKDNVHPNTEGATLIAKAVFKSLTGKAWEGEIPGPQSVKKDKRGIRDVENPGELSYRELFALIAAETALPSEKLAPLREKFEVTAPVVEAKIHDFEDQIQQADKLRMKYKHTNVEAEKPLYGEYRAKIAAMHKELARYKRDTEAELIALVPDEGKGPLGAARVRKYVLDRLTPVATTLTSEQRKRITAICQQAGLAYGKINNTPERSIADVETYKLVYQQVLDAEQRKRVEPR